MARSNGRRNDRRTVTGWLAGAALVLVVSCVVLTPRSAFGQVAPTTTSSTTTTTVPPTTLPPATLPPATIPATTPTTAAPTTTSAVTTTTLVPAPATSSSSTPWGWIIVGIALAVAVVAVVVALLRGRSREQAMRAWRAQTRSALDASRLAATLLPASGRDITDSQHWLSVRARVEEAAQGLERAATSAPTGDAASAARHTSEALRGLVFALESDRLLRDAPVAPTADQLIEADAAMRARRADLDAALAHLDGLIGPAPPQPAGG